jgi:hypothetical protein
VKFHHNKLYFSLLTKIVFVHVVHVLELLDLHDVGFQSLLEDFLENRLAVVVVGEAHAPEAVVVEPQQCSSRDVVHDEEILVLVAIFGAVSSVPLDDVRCRPVVDGFGSRCFCLDDFFVGFLMNVKFNKFSLILMICGDFYVFDIFYVFL